MMKRSDSLFFPFMKNSPTGVWNENSVKSTKIYYACSSGFRLTFSFFFYRTLIETCHALHAQNTVPQFIHWSPNLLGDGLSKWGLWEENSIGSWMELVPCKKRPMGNIWVDSEKMAIYKPGSQLQQTLNLQALPCLQTCEKLISCKPKEVQIIAQGE